MTVLDLVCLWRNALHWAHTVLLQCWHVNQLVAEVLELLEIVLEGAAAKVHHLALVGSCRGNILCEILVHEFLEIMEVLTSVASLQGVNEGLLYRQVVGTLISRGFEV